MKKLIIPILAGAIAITAFMPFAAEARRGGGGGMGGGQNGIQSQNRQRLQDGSCLNGNGPQAGSRAQNQNGKTYGPGDGNGNAGVGPKDGTGYGAPSQR